ncbi:hypothetical protein [Planococcus halotolerans]|uniref:DUF3600 domain-containing protein n=1 Tax=Planococcus halotolerans TaxID=2233542 RepID=A0A365L7I5_9BACL|nr:hypothetical protein [Planococcus halotolerans]RAZ81368.1 hypothetical protein DP120_03550 [Planococcus halotolerans]
MNNKVKEEVDHIKVPKEKLHQRIELGVDQAELKDKNKKRKAPKWIIGLVASAMIAAAVWSLGGSSLADAAESLFTQVFVTEETLKEAYPEEEVTSEGMTAIEGQLQILEQNLSEEDFAEFSRLLEEQTEILKGMEDETKINFTDEESEKVEEIQAKMQKIVGDLLD